MKKITKIAVGAALAAGTLGLSSCENKNENQDDKTKPQTEQRKASGSLLLQEIENHGIPITKKAQKEGEVDSLLHSIKFDEKGKIFDPQYVEQLSDPSTTRLSDTEEIHYYAHKLDPNKAKLENVKDVGDAFEAEFSYKNEEISEEKAIQEFLKAKTDSIKELKERVESKRNHKENRNSNNFEDFLDTQKVIDNLTTIELNNKEYQAYSETTMYKGDTVSVEFGFTDANNTDNRTTAQVTASKTEPEKKQVNRVSDWTTVDFSDSDEERISANKPEPKKKEPPKGSISHDAFINALLEQKRCGRK